MDTWLPIVISFAALGISGFTLWTTHLKGPSLNVAPAGRLTLTSDPRSEGASRPAIIVPFLVTNSGAQQAYVLDVAVEVEANDEREIFRSLFEQNEDKMNLGEELSPLDLSPFHSFVVGPGETVLKRVFLILMDDHSAFTFRPGKLFVVPLTRTAHAPQRWERWDTLEVQLDQEDRQALDSTVTRQMPDGSRAVKLMMRTKPTVPARNALKKLKE